MIFIVDDDESVRTSLTRLLRSGGHEARAFANAEACLDELDGTGAAAMIVDLHMPGMSGLELQEVVNGREPPVPVIVLTATEDAEMRVRALVAGARKVLRKPCDSTVLLRAVADAIDAPPPPPAGHARPGVDRTMRAGELGRGDVESENPDHFILAEDHAAYHPQGCVSFEEVVNLVRGAIAAARRHHARDLVVDTTALTGFPSPDTFERFLAAVEWAKEAREGVRLAMVARAEMIHPQKLGVIVAANRGLATNIFTTESDARAWLAGGDRP